jgi:hypothetical protein
MWGRWAAATAISNGVALVMSLAAVADADTGVLWDLPLRMVQVAVVWLVGWPLRLTLFPPPEPEEDAGERRPGRVRTGV